MATFEIKQNDTDLPLSAETDITGATIKASIRTMGVDTEVPATVPVAVTNASTGDFDVLVSGVDWGNFDLEVKITKDGRDIHIPPRGFHRLHISPNLDDPLAGPYVPSATLDQVIEEKFAGEADRIIPFAETAVEAAAEAGVFAASTEFDANRAGESAFQSGQSAGYALGHRNAAASSADVASAAAASVAAANRRTRAQRAIGFGDSIMQASDGVASGYGGSWFSKLAELSGQRIQRVRNAGIAGNSTTAMLARLNADVLTQRGDIVVVEAITPNDDPATVTLAQQQRNVRSIIEQCLYRNKRVIVCDGPPNNNPAIAARMRTMSTWVRSLATQMGLDVIDLFTPVGDPATGAWLPGFTADGVHPNAAGQDAIATFNAARVPDDLRPAPVLANLGDTTNLITGNGLFEVDTNADGYADGWTNSGLAAGSLIARADGVGNWQSITGDQSTDYLQQAGITGWNVGDTLALSGEWVNIDGSTVNVELRFTGGTPYSTARAISARAETGPVRTFYMEIPVPTGTTAVNLRMWPGIGTARFGRVKLANLTTLGLI
jgi:lysophospholipase L1-like esterase